MNLGMYNEEVSIRAVIFNFGKIRDKLIFSKKMGLGLCIIRMRQYAPGLLYY